ncbi:hypothetical protein [Altererythrobacter sp. MF3-039]|uniref:hypothetical protein n=1 Tax=Altererythrobacter sp. MF3-039 TaxID=3252901 RepID=UPI00390C6284
MTDERRIWVVWIIGLTLFAIAIALGMAITQGSVTLGILEHQAAGTAERVNEIQAQWKAGDVRGIAIAAMVADLAFIGVFAWGSYLLGRLLLANGAMPVRSIGAIVTASAIIFGLTDYIETILQLIQLLLDRGIDGMAATAATVRPVKVATWIICFLGVLVGFTLRKLLAKRG